MSRVALFSHAENLRVASRVGFRPHTCTAAGAMLDETRATWSLPPQWTAEERAQVHFFLALGLYVFIQEDDHGIPIPDDLTDWHRRFVAACADTDALFIDPDQPAESIDPRWLEGAA